jgi:hypothetical protein
VLGGEVGERREGLMGLMGAFGEALGEALFGRVLERMGRLLR